MDEWSVYIISTRVPLPHSSQTKLVKTIFAFELLSYVNTLPMQTLK